MAAFELRLTASSISPSFPGSDHRKLACWDPGKHKEGPLPKASFCALSSCPFCLFPRFLPSFCAATVLRVSVLRDDPPFLLQSIPLSLVSPSQLIVCVLARWGGGLSSAPCRAPVWYPQMAGLGMCQQTDNTGTCLLVGDTWKTSPQWLTHPTPSPVLRYLASQASLASSLGGTSALAMSFS